MKCTIVVIPIPAINNIHKKHLHTVIGSKCFLCNYNSEDFQKINLRQPLFVFKDIKKFLNTLKIYCGFICHGNKRNVDLLLRNAYKIKIPRRNITESSHKEPI